MVYAVSFNNKLMMISIFNYMHTADPNKMISSSLVP